MPAADTNPATLHEAMRYTVLGGGKRIRPALVYAGGQLAGVEPDALDPAAAAVELIHAYSLVHDDLPVMDDDDLRHGQPTVHVRFGEAMAVLVGDALQALAFETVAVDAEPRLAQRWTQLLSGAAGAGGMVGGQVLDLAAEASEEPLQLADLETMHRRKTGALIRASVLLGASAGALRDEELEAVDAFARDIGLAFQIYDDVLDVIGTTAELGKPQGSDERQGQDHLRHAARPRRSEAGGATTLRARRRPPRLVRPPRRRLARDRQLRRRAGLAEACAGRGNAGVAPTEGCRFMPRS